MVSIFAVGVVVLIFQLVLKHEDDTFPQVVIVRIVFVGFGLIFLGILGYMVWASVADIKRGFKYRVKGMVTNKRMKINTSTSHSSVGGRPRGSSTTRHYYLYINDEEFAVSHKYYNQVPIGFQVVLDRAPRSKVVLSLEVLA